MMEEQLQQLKARRLFLHLRSTCVLMGIDYSEFFAQQILKLAFMKSRNVMALQLCS
jgi:hypothetical protein